MAAMTQNNALINPKNVFNWNKFNILNHTNLSDELSYLSEQSKLKSYFLFNSLQTRPDSNTNAQKRKFDYLIDEVEISENSNSSLGESSKFSECESNADGRSETSSLISIENVEDEANVKNQSQNKSANGQTSKKEEKKKRKNRRNRTVFTELQLMGLERRFDQTKYLSTPDRAELANALGLSQLQVKTWYHNRRMKWKKQVMQDGCLVAPTKPKGRPKKGTIPSLGLTFDTSSLLSAMESRKNSSLLDKEINSNSYLGVKGGNANGLSLASMNPMMNGKDLSGIAANNQQLMNQISSKHFAQNDLNHHQFYNNKIESFGIKKAKLVAF